MLSREDNDILIHTGPGTLMGNLLRRYWLPACLTSEIPTPDSTPIRVRILSEDLVGFRDTQGRVGLIDENCPHRGTSLFFGRNEESGLRCVYHGWKFDIYGNCVEMPSEPESNGFMSKLKMLSYPTHESGGVIWVYMGPKDQMPGFRDFGTEDLPREKWRAGYFVQPMNWMQAMEGTIDTTHPSWLHAWKGAADIEDDGSDAPGMYNSGKMQWKFWAHDRAPRVEVVDTWHGWRAAGLRDTPKGNTHARLYQYTFPITAGPGGGAWVVPVDDTQTRLWQMVTVNTAMKASMVVGGYLGLDFEGWPYDDDGKVRNRENDWLIDRESQKTVRSTQASVASSTTRTSWPRRPPSRTAPGSTWALWTARSSACAACYSTPLRTSTRASSVRASTRPCPTRRSARLTKCSNPVRTGRCWAPRSTRT